MTGASDRWNKSLGLLTPGIRVKQVTEALPVVEPEASIMAITAQREGTRISAVPAAAVTAALAFLLMDTWATFTDGKAAAVGQKKRGLR